MTDREILAQLKKSYENLQDIRENGCNDHCTGQLENKQIQQLEGVMKNLSNVYSDFYDSLDNKTLSINKNKIDEYIQGWQNFDKYNIPIYDKMLNQNQELFENAYKVRIDKDITGYYEVINNDGTSDYVGMDVLCNYEWYNDPDYLNGCIEREEDYEM